MSFSDRDVAARLRRLAACLTVGLAFGASAAETTDPYAPLPARLPTDVRPLHYDIVVEPDARTLTFKGHETIDVEVSRATRSITLNAADLELSGIALDGRTHGTATLDAEKQTATLAFPDTVSPGTHRLAISFSGRINRSAAGLFALDYGSSAGPQRMLTTQFEPADGRLFVPMWDEPAVKATFTLQAVIPPSQRAFSNMPEESNRVVGGKRHVRFLPTPKMSSYLLHLTVGDLERVSRTVAGVDVGVVTRRGASSQGAFALDAIAEILPWYNDYFGTPYPLPKLDMIAAPGRSQFFGAMENWGAILYFEPYLLLDPSHSSEWNRQDIFDSVAHEVAHQWFGDLVTMQWWDDLWLNEGFATWMAAKVADALHPAWKPWLQSVAGPRERAMELDAGAATHAVLQPIDSLERISLAFDAIAYSKGAAVIRMLEETAGPEAFRDGMRRYMKKYAYQNTVTDQLWQEIGGATARPVVEIARDFTLQPGVPLVTVAAQDCEAGGRALGLTQSRFETDEPSAGGVAWHIPIRVRAVGRDDGGSLVMPKDGTSTLRIATCGPYVVNAGQAGYFRTLYPASELARLRESFAGIAEIDQLGLLADAYALGGAGRVPATTYLDFVSAVPAASDPLIWLQVSQSLRAIDRMFDKSAEQVRWRKLAQALLAPQFARAGWTPQPGQGDNVAILRESLIRTLGELDDATVVEECHARFLRETRDPGAVPAAIRESLLGVTARHADEATWQEILARARKEASPVEQARMYTRLGMALDPALAKRALDLAISGEPPATVAPSIISAVSDRHPALAFDFAVAHQDAVLALIEASSKWAYIPELASSSADPAVADRVRIFMTRAIPPGGRKTAQEAIAEIDRRARSYAHSLPQLETWVRAQ